MNFETLFSPAKINLFLAITGPRSDGYHDLISLVSQVGLGDEIDIAQTEEAGISFACDQSDLPSNESNLVVQALLLLQRKTKHAGGWSVCLRKRIPVGGGLGGGSSNAAITLLAANRLLEYPLSKNQLSQMASEIGSDCPFFLEKTACVLRGRGELTEIVDRSVQKRLQGRKIALFWPSWAISTSWAYSNLANFPQTFTSHPKAEASLSQWLEDGQPAEGVVSNDFEPSLTSRFPTFSILLDHVRRVLGMSCSISGSGSTCFALSSDDSMLDDLEGEVRSCWGDEAGFVITTLL
ncbi:MAG: 4-(cytidine 5'-diphospho)-2-C-methyl-D-erythritol kinase [Opitutales bacterium]